MIWFIANCGGILGLCMGFSLITVFEIAQYIFHGTLAKITSSCTPEEPDTEVRLCKRRCCCCCASEDLDHVTGSRESQNNHHLQQIDLDGIILHVEHTNNSATATNAGEVEPLTNVSAGCRSNHKVKKRSAELS